MVRPHVLPVSLDTFHLSLNRRQMLQLAGMTAATTLSSRRSSAGEKKWRVCVIGHTGLGNYGHGLDTVWESLPETEVVGFADANDAGREKEKSKLPNIPAFADYQKMLEDLKPDIVAVGPRDVSEHHDIILAAIAAGAQGIYCEKPFCRTPAEADEIVAACERSGTRFALAHRNRFHPALRVAIELVKSGEIGDLLEIRCRGKEDQRGGCLDLWVLGCHEFDLMLPLTGKALSCSALIQQGNRPATKADVTQGAEGVGPLLGNQVHARFEMENGVPMYFDSVQNKGVREANFGVQLIGNKGLIDFRIDVEPLAQLVPGNPFQPTMSARPCITITSAGVGQPEPIPNLKREIANHVIPVRNLLSSIKEKTSSLSNDQTGRHVVEMTHAVLTSHIQGGASVPLPLANRGHGLSAWL